MKTDSLITTRIAAAVMAGFLATAVAQAQPTEPTENTSADKPVIQTYDVTVSDAIDGESDVIRTYEKRPNPEGDAQDLDYHRYRELNTANDGEGFSVVKFPSENEPDEDDKEI